MTHVGRKRPVVQGWERPQCRQQSGLLRGWVLVWAPWLLLLHGAGRLKGATSIPCQPLLQHLPMRKLIWHRVCIGIRMKP